MPNPLTPVEKWTLSSRGRILGNRNQRIPNALWALARLLTTCDGYRQRMNKRSRLRTLSSLYVCAWLGSKRTELGG